MYYVYLIALSAFVCAVVLGGIGTLLLTVIPYKGLKCIGSHLAAEDNLEDIYYWGLTVKTVKDYEKGLIMPINGDLGEESTSRLMNTVVISIFSIVMLLTSIIGGVVGGVNMARARADYYAYSDVYHMYSVMYDPDQELANIGYTQQVISYNEWLVEARANLETFGKHSKWYEYDLYSITYITMRGGE